MWWPGVGYGFGGGVMLLMMVFMAIFWILLLVGTFFIVRGLMDSGAMGQGPPKVNHKPKKGEEFVETAVDVLKKRYALGEIDKKEFDEKKRELEES